MRTVIATAVVTAAIFSAGYVIGETSGMLPTYAAATTATPTVPSITGPSSGSGVYIHRDTPHADGTVTAVNGDNITVQADVDPAGSTEYTKVTTITLGSSTQYDTGTTGASITVGSRILAEGTVSSDGTTLAATRVHVMGAGRLGHAGHFGGPGGFGPHADGTVQSVSGNSIAVKTDNDPIGSTEYAKVTTIQVSSTTTYDAGRDSTATKDSIKAGTYVIAVGTVSSDGTTLNATHVTVLTGAPTHTGFHGMFR